ncbi:ribosome assembly cofactor RimP [Mycoplasmopsis felifaucium]|uniref:ribosome assembly cofactor RimP n=1 Tax=Mycoplasmopsis felifaucium TaxID=35768 RepID=UPI0004820873|nr:ribosome assembly cofactor RimP [Mycoplasmopsis felifaucium]
MNWKTFLVDKFKEQIKDVKITNEFGAQCLDICVNTTDLTELDRLSGEINSFIDNSGKELNYDVVSIHSPGFDTDLNVEDLANYIDSDLEFKLIKNIDKKDLYIGKLVEVNSNIAKVKWNCKGQFRTVEIPFENIKKVSLYFKF